MGEGSREGGTNGGTVEEEREWDVGRERGSEEGREGVI